jgi:hypothetical protein
MASPAETGKFNLPNKSIENLPNTSSINEVRPSMHEPSAPLPPEGNIFKPEKTPELTPKKSLDEISILPNQDSNNPGPSNHKSENPVNKNEEYIQRAKKLKEKKNENFSEEDIRFLYKLGKHKKNFEDVNEDPHIENIKKNRDQKEDLSLVLNIPKQDISLTREEALKGSKYHYGNLNISDIKSAKGLTLPNEVEGDAYMNSLNELPKGFTKKIGGDLHIYMATTIPEDFTFPETEGIVYINDILDKKVTLPKGTRTMIIPSEIFKIKKGNIYTRLGARIKRFLKR